MSVLGFDAPNSEPWIRFWKSVMSASDTGAPTSVMSPSPVTTTVPALRIEAIAWPTCSPLVTPTVTIAESAPWPLVNDCASSVASSIVSHACVAPSSCAFSRLNATGSTAMTFDAPACAAPWTALMPMPPMPMTMTVSPGGDLGRVDRRAPAGADAAADEARLLERDVVGDLHRRVDGDRW